MSDYVRDAAASISSRLQQDANIMVDVALSGIETPADHPAKDIYRDAFIAGTLYSVTWLLGQVQSLDDDHADAIHGFAEAILLVGDKH